MAWQDDFNEVYEQVLALEADFVTFRGEDEDRIDLYAMRRSVELAEDIAREAQVDILSPDVIWAANTIRSDLLAMDTEITCTPTARDERGGIRAEDQRRADAVERASAVWWNRQDEGRRLSRPVIWRQLVNRLGIVIFECHDVPPPEQRGQTDKEYERILTKWQAERWPWRTFEVDPLTCAWEHSQGRPTVFARRYKQLVSRTQQVYSRQARTEMADADLVLEDGRWQWRQAKPLSDDYTPFETRNAAGRRIRELDMLFLDDGEYIWHVAMNADGKAGQVVYKARNEYGRVSAVLVPGNDTPLRRPEDTYEPFLWPLMMDTEQLNVIETMRATAARNVTGPQEYIAADPEFVKAYMATHNGQLPPAHTWEPGETPYLPGEIKTRPSGLPDDWDKLEQRIEERAQRHRPQSQMILADPGVTKSGTAAGILAGIDSYFRQLAPVVGAWDSAKKQLMEMFHTSVQVLSQRGGSFSSYTFAARGREWVRGKRLGVGEAYQLDADTFQFAYDFDVTTRMRTESQVVARYQAKLEQYMLPDGKRGPASYKDLLAAADYTDEEAQIVQLAEEAVLDRMDTWLDALAQMAAGFEIEADSGIRVPFPALGQQQAPPPPPPPTAAPPAGPQLTASPALQGPEGGTGATI
jgi:hypothetical protein